MELITCWGLDKYARSHHMDNEGYYTYGALLHYNRVHNCTLGKENTTTKILKKLFGHNIIFIVTKNP